MQSMLGLVYTKNDWCWNVQPFFLFFPFYFRQPSVSRYLDIQTHKHTTHAHYSNELNQYMNVPFLLFLLYSISFLFSAHPKFSERLTQTELCSFYTNGNSFKSCLVLGLFSSLPFCVYIHMQKKKVRDKHLGLTMTHSCMNRFKISVHLDSNVRLNENIGTKL